MPDDADTPEPDPIEFISRSLAAGAHLDFQRGAYNLGGGECSIADIDKPVRMDWEAEYRSSSLRGLIRAAFNMGFSSESDRDVSDDDKRHLLLIESEIQRRIEYAPAFNPIPSTISTEAEIAAQVARVETSWLHREMSAAEEKLARIAALVADWPRSPIDHDQLIREIRSIAGKALEEAK